MRLRQIFTGELTHRELIGLVYALPREGALGRALLGDVADWSPEVARLTSIADLLAGANWQRTGKRTGAPKPTKPPKVPDLEL